MNSKFFGKFSIVFFLLITVFVSFKSQKVVIPESLASSGLERTLKTPQTPHKEARSGRRPANKYAHEELKLSHRERSKKIYEEAAKLPEHNSVKDPERDVDPVAVKLKRESKTSLSLSDSSLAMESYLDKNYYLKSDASATLRMKLNQQGIAADGKVQVHLESVGLIPVQRDAQGDYTAQMDLSKLNPGRHMLKIKAVRDTEEVVSVHSFQLSEDSLRPTGKYKTGLSSEGDLEFWVQVDVFERGHYLFESVAHSKSGPVAQSQVALQLDKGTHFIRLDFHGLMFYERKISGPFEFKYLEVTRVDENLTMQGVFHFMPNHVSEFFDWSQFNASEFGNELVRSKLARMN